MTGSSAAAFPFPWFLLSSISPTPEVPVLEVVKVYGSLATRDCFGKTAPPGSSCQLPLLVLEQELGLTTAPFSIKFDDFNEKLKGMDFRWPLKPFGIEKSNEKTATMNKGAETRIFMEELEKRGLYDKRDPTGPLPTSLRPKLNKMISGDELGEATSRAFFRAFNAGKGDDVLTKQALEKSFQGRDVIDYYGMLDLIGKESISWPY